MTHSDSNNSNLVPSSKNELTTASTLVSRGLTLAEKIIEPSKYKASVLIVNNDPDILDVIELCLYENYTVVKSPNEFDALEKLRNNNYDLLITSFMLQGFNGIELVKKAQDLRPDLSTIIMPYKSTIIMPYKNDPPIYFKMIPEMFSKVRTALVMAPFEPNYLLGVIERILRMNKPNLILVNNDSYMLEAFNVLMAQQYKINKLCNGYDALEELEKNNYEVLITDFGLSDINGIELIKRAKKLKPELLTMIISSNTKEISLDALALGCSACFELNVTPEHIETTIEKVLKLNG